jgi:DNA-binding LytR/AlgR family response regulator
MDKDKLPFIIFVTAYDQYALKAFDVHAVDYLLKPYDNDRFERALSHARQQILTKDQASLNHRLLNVISEFEQQHLDEDLKIEITVFATAGGINFSGRFALLSCKKDTFACVCRLLDLLVNHS